jgi:hypothetical protein
MVAFQLSMAVCVSGRQCDETFRAHGLRSIDLSMVNALFNFNVIVLYIFPPEADYFSGSHPGMNRQPHDP